MTDASAGDRQSLGQLYGRFLGSLRIDSQSIDQGALAHKPLEIPRIGLSPHPLRLYIFNCTQHATERRAGDYRIQLRLPGQQRGERGQLVMDGEAQTMLVGYVAEFDVFVLWDAYAHATFPYSKGIQVAADTVHSAAIGGQAEQERDVRSSSYKEWVIATRADQLRTGLQLRRDRTRESLLLSGTAGSP